MSIPHEKMRQIHSTVREIFELSGISAEDHPKEESFILRGLTVEKVSNTKDRTGQRARSLARRLLPAISGLISPNDPYAFTVAMENACHEF